jgi:hypothetical protein
LRWAVASVASVALGTSVTIGGLAAGGLGLPLQRLLADFFELDTTDVVTR